MGQAKGGKDVFSGLYVKIRRAVMVEGKSEREVARFLGFTAARQEDVPIRCAARLPWLYCKK
ncbi:MAG: hypothetical protein ABI167_11995 [Nitrosospira sp.]